MFYNRQRMHSGLSYRIPVQYEAQMRAQGAWGCVRKPEQVQVLDEDWETLSANGIRVFDQR